MEQGRIANGVNEGREGVNAITGQIVTSAIEVHRALGPGLLESVYERCLAYELIQKGLRVETQKEVPIRYKEVQLECGCGGDQGGGETDTCASGTDYDLYAAGRDENGAAD